MVLGFGMEVMFLIMTELQKPLKNVQDNVIENLGAISGHLIIKIVFFFHP